jgi:acetylornithine/N-succinyldiaminopimelate aminotransferase
MSSQETLELFQRHIIPSCGRYPIALQRGEGAYVWDAEGNRYLDLFCGRGSNLLGHCPPAIVAAVRNQMGRLIHVPNAWHTELQGLWAKALAQRSFGGQAMFCNSGSEANEAAIKLARLHAGKHRYKIITFEGGFHGCTLGAVSATAQPKYREGLGPLAAGFVPAPFGDLGAAERLVDGETAAIMIEPIQGDGGVRVPPDGFLAGLRSLADDHELILIFDEVQTGCGRTGNWFACQGFGVSPDIMTLAEGLCGGLAAGAVLSTAEIAQSLPPGMHACTFGGNPIAACAGLALLETIEREQLLEQAKRLGEIFGQRLEQLRRELGLVRDIRIRGAMIGIELSIQGAETVRACLERGLLVDCTQETVIRLLPPINLTEEQAHEGCDILIDVLRKRRRDDG